jgi:hypothetical protein
MGCPQQRREISHAVASWSETSRLQQRPLSKPILSIEKSLSISKCDESEAIVQPCRSDVRPKVFRPMRPPKLNYHIEFSYAHFHLQPALAPHPPQFKLCSHPKNRFTAHSFFNHVCAGGLANEAATAAERTEQYVSVLVKKMKQR